MFTISNGIILKGQDLFPSKENIVVEDGDKKKETTVTKVMGDGSKQIAIIKEKDLTKYNIQLNTVRAKIKELQEE